MMMLSRARLRAVCCMTLGSVAIALSQLALAAENAVVALDESADLTKSLNAVFDEMGPEYKPRTEHFLDSGEPAYLNRLIKESSPYLLQHAHNPVNWYPWGGEAFDVAKKSDKPVFLSIGYATCHWCHVMERESFENEAIAALLNEHFIAIKVDREQLPDVDATYMSAVQILSGSGGWPMSSFLMADAKPFYGGTYYPPETFTDLLNQIADLWAKERDTITNHATELADAVAQNARLSGQAAEVGQVQIDKAIEQLLASHDDFEGGFGAAPKFPQESKLFLLLEHARRTGHGGALSAAHFTLQSIAAGGIHDQLAGGFHRYAVDDQWLVPHFEKMLYNQAALTRNFVDAYLLTGDKSHERTARRALDYVLREMTAPGGGFYSATDADSEGGEGNFFIWSLDELDAVLGAEDAALAADIWNATEHGNFEERNILHLSEPMDDLSRSHSIPLAELQASIDYWSEKLLQVRNQREKPLRDEKIITAWNGMMITALAETGNVLDSDHYIDAAVRAGEFVWRNNRRDDGRLWRTFYNGKPAIASSQEDYAFLAEGYIALFDATDARKWLERAEVLVNSMTDQFWDEDEGGYFIGEVVTGGAALPVRPKDLFDNATPTGNAAALRALARLWHRTGNDDYRQRAEQLVVAFSTYLNRYPSAFSYMLAAASELLDGESGHTQYVARGNVKIEAIAQRNQLQVALSMKDGWHVNSNKPIQDYLIPTRILHPDGNHMDNAVYPEAVQKVLGFERSTLALYENRVVITAPLPEPDPADGRTVASVLAQLQACNDEVCLPPESVRLNVSLANQMR